MLNHSSRAGRSSCLRFNPLLGSASLCAYRACKEGEEVEDSYGPDLTTAELVLDYGFVDDENGKDAIHLPVMIR